MNSKKILFEVKKYAVITLCIVCMLFFAISGCGGSKMSDIEEPVNASCENKIILKVLNDEPAIMRKQCFEHIGRVDAFYFELVNRHSEFFSEYGVFPAGEIPQKYRKEGMSVYISGKVTNCSISTLGCLDTQFYRLRPQNLYLFELKSIKN